MLSLLAKILGPNRAVTAYVNIRRFGIPVGLVIGFAVMFWLIVRISNPDRMEHLAYIRADVIAVTPLMQDANSGVFIDVRLPDGRELKLTEIEGAISNELGDMACLERRRDTVTEEISYRLRRLHRCAG
ncbi:hypothetical protein [Aestuariivita sp.]|jgi:hypothetical protein|uniref:hypothetical protein n=1 Tax=Aestuariivita sp. TaxID=1872407 RepID=UPI00216FAB49|nr:hypothetical protein [Aestuariivita sp.]MCE8007346.1 hypothetical protein [Aestuariivita sp.]